MAVATEIPELAALKQALNSNEEAGGSLEKAALLVASFADQQAVSALDNILAAADGPDQAGAATKTREAADRVVQQTEMLLCEVTRFLSLPRETPSKAQNPT